MNCIEKINNLQNVKYIKSLTCDDMINLGIMDVNNTKEETLSQYTLIKNYCDNMIKSNGCMDIVYKPSDYSPHGRLFGKNSIQKISGVIRGFLFNGISTDLDFQNAHPKIALYICNKNNIHCPNLTDYCNNRSKWLQIEDGVKLTVISMLNNHKINYNIKNPLLREFDKELKRIQTAIYNLETYKHITINADNSKNNLIGSAFNRVLCYYENRLLTDLCERLQSYHGKAICTKMYDGCMIYGDIDDNTASLIIKDCEEYINNKWRINNIELNIVITKKPHDTSIKIPNNWVEPITTEDGTDICMVDNDKDASIYIYNKVKDILKSYNGRLFYKHENIWVDDFNKLQNILKNMIINANIYGKERNNKGQLVPYSQHITKAKHILEALISKVIVENDDPELYNKFHSTCKNKLCFNDGVLYVKDKKFVKWEYVKDVYSCVKINRDFSDYFANPDRKIINDIKTNLFDNSYGDKCELALNFLSRAITGNNQDKTWATYLGNRNSGKGVEFDLLKTAFENYVNSFEVSHILYNRKGAGFDNENASKKMYWCLDLEFCRLAISQEVPDSKTELKLKGVILKKITGGGDDIIGKRNYDKTDTTIKMDTTFYIKGNNSVSPDMPDCDKTRLCFNSVIQYETQEVIDKAIANNERPEYINKMRVKDYTIKDKMKTAEYANAMVYMLYENFIDKPVEMFNDDNEQEGSNIINDIYEIFEITGDHDNDMLSVDEVNSLLKIYDKGTIKNELQNINVFKKKNRQRGSIYYNKWVYTGIKKIVVDEIIIEE